MNELENQLSRVVEKAIKIAEQTGQFAIDQAPDLLQEFYRWHLTKNIFLAIICLIIIVLIWNFFKRFGSEDREGYDDIELFGKHYNDFAGVMMLVFLVLGGIGTSLGYLINSLYNIIFILTAPKLYLIEYFLI